MTSARIRALPLTELRSTNLSSLPFRMLPLLQRTAEETFVDLVIAYEAMDEDSDDIEGPAFRLCLPC